MISTPLKSLWVVIIGILLFSACSYNSEEELLTPGCDVQNVSLLVDVIPVFESSCTGCHNANAPSGGVLLDSYNEIKISAENGSLSGSINHSAGFSPMPQGMQKLDSCDIAKIDAWIEDGFPNN